jgi:FLVCR family MFS transporter 7
VAALVQPLSLNLAARLASDWFPADERDLATTVATAGNVLGCLVCSALAPLLVHTPAQLGRVLAVQLPPGLAVTAAAWALLEERPPSPPSASAALQWRERAAAAAAAKGAPGAAAALAMVRDMRALLSNGNYLLLACGFATGSGTVWAVLVLESQLITPCGYSDATAGLAGAVLLGAGVLSAFGVGGVMKTTKAYVPLQRGVMAAALAATAALLGASRPGRRGALIASYALMGCALQPLMPLTLEHAAEITFPLSADVSTSVLFMFANAFASVLVLLLTPLLALPASAMCATVFTPAAALVLALMAAGLGVTCAVRRDYRRSGCERSGAEQEARLLGGAGGDARSYGTPHLSAG